MSFINSYYINSEVTLNPESLRSGCLRRLFNIGTNNIIGIMNDFKLPTLLFIYEKKSTLIEIQLMSHLFLSIIQRNYSSMIGLSNQQLLLGEYPISTPFFHHTKQSSIFAHSIVLRQDNNQYYVSHLPISIQTFSCEVLNDFKEQVNQIVDQTT